MTELAIADTSPQPPHVIRQLLEKLGLTYQARHDLILFFGGPGVSICNWKPRTAPWRCANGPARRPAYY